MLAVHPVSAARGQERKLRGWQRPDRWPLSQNLTTGWVDWRPLAEAAAA